VFSVLRLTALNYVYIIYPFPPVAESKCIVKLCPASLQWKVGHCSIINGHPTNYDLSELCCGRCVSNCGVILQRSCFATQSAASVVAMSPGDSPVPNGARQVSQSQICWAKEILLRNCNLPKTATQCDQNSLWVSCYQKKLCNVPLCVCVGPLCAALGAWLFFICPGISTKHHRLMSFPH
jgi:hypothetical protein